MIKEELTKLLMEAYERGQSDLIKSCQETVSIAIDTAILSEREACAKVCEDSVEYAGDTLAELIRARGNTNQFERCPFIECDCDGNHPLNQPAIRARGQA